MLLFMPLVPAASGDWGVQGEREPNSAFDSTSWIFTDAPVDPLRNRVYFNGMIVHSYTGINPNLGVLGGSAVVPGPQFAIAYLGVWRDCNRDGYIGAIETALLEYRNEALGDRTLCPMSTPPGPGYEAHYPHNDGEWVREFRWIGWVDNAANPQSVTPGMIHDGDSLVWADDGRPGEESIVGCPLNPPRGTFSTTGGVLAWADCYGLRGILEGTKRVDEVTQPVQDASGQEMDLTFENEGAPQCSGSTLHVPLDFFYRDAQCPRSDAGLLEPRSDQPMFVVWDCSNRLYVADQHDRTVVSQPLIHPVPHLDTEGSAYDGMSGLVGGLDGHCSWTGGSSLDDAYVGLHPEQAFIATRVKRETTFAYEFFNDRSGSYVGRTYEDPRLPPNLGVNAVNGAGALAPIGGSRLGAGWQSQVTRVDGPPLLRDEIVAGAGPSYYTFYASLGQTSFALGLETPNQGRFGIYGIEWCGTQTSGIYRGVDCDAETWWEPEHGASQMPRATWSRNGLGVRVGAPYHLRDIDCKDGSVEKISGTDLPGLTILSEEGPCEGFR